MANLQKLLNDAEDIVILEKTPAEDRYRFAVPFKGNLARQGYDESLKIDSELPEFSKYWRFNEQTQQINGSSIPLLVRLQKVLRPQGLELPDSLDLLALDKQRKLINGFYRDCGIAIFSNDNHNQDTAKILIEKGKQEGWDLPLLYGFRDLDYVISNNRVKSIPVEKPRRVVFGKEAEKVLERFFKASQGAQRVCRYRDGWVAGWVDFAYLGPDGLVDFVCAEGTRENLREGYNHLFERKYSARIANLQRQKAEEERQVLEALKA